MELIHFSSFFSLAASTMPSNKKKGRSAKKGAKDDRKAEKERKKIEARLIHEPCPNGLRCADPKCRHVHVCPNALEVLLRMTLCHYEDEGDVPPAFKRVFPGGIDMTTPIETMSAEQQELLVAARRGLVESMIKDSGHDFRFVACSRNECRDAIELKGFSKGNTDLRKEIDELYCDKCDRVFCQECIGTCKGCNVRFCYDCDRFLGFTFKDSKGVVGEVLRATEGHCKSCAIPMFPKTAHALDDTKYRTLMREMYLEVPSCAYCAASLPNGPETKRCGDCSAVRYCDKECQEKDWSDKHREYCEVLRQDRNDRLAKWYQKRQPKLEEEAGLWDIE